jgi:hypothetical protein
MNCLVIAIICPQAPASGGFDWVAIAGIIGTLLGTGLGAYVTWKIQKAQLVHEDRTRFHDRRLIVYSDYTSSCNKIFSAHATKTHASEKDLDQFLQSTELLRLIASDQVFNKAIVLHSIITRINKEDVVHSEALAAEFNSGMADLAIAIRKEIGVAKIDQKEK